MCSGRTESGQPTGPGPETNLGRRILRGRTFWAVSPVSQRLLCARVTPELMSHAGSADQAKLDAMFDSFNRAWARYWDSYVALQTQLYDSIQAAREVQWLAATDPKKLSEINRLQRELFASMPRRLDYEPLGQVSQDADAASSKIDELDAALTKEEEACEKLKQAIATLREQTKTMQEALNTPGH